MTHKSVELFANKEVQKEEHLKRGLHKKYAKAHDLTKRLRVKSGKMLEKRC